MRKPLIIGVVAGLLLMGAGGAAQAAPAANTAFYVGTIGALDPTKAYTVQELQTINEASLRAAATTTSGATAAPGLVALDPTPNGFKLWNPGTRTTSYIYNSNNWGANLSRCNPTCTVIDTWNHQIREYVYGGTSTRWLNTMNATRVRGSTPTSFGFEYYCGTDRNNAQDTLCAGGGADHSTSRAMNPGEVVDRSFGAATSTRVFPMIRISALFRTPSGSVVVSTPFRGWDVCNNNAGTTKLCTSATY